MTEHLLELDRITKTYPGVVALDQVSLAVGRGEIVGLIGENGAGKSTLMKVLGGVVEPSAGKIRLDGKEHAALSVREAMAGGIAFVHQELNLFDNLDAAANVFIGREPRYGGPLRLIDRRKLREQVRGAAAARGRGFRPRYPRGRSVAGPAPAAGDRQGALARGPARHHGRAHLLPHPVGDRPADGGDRRSQGPWRQHHLHFPPPQRDQALRRPGGRAARRQGRRRAGARARSIPRR